MNHGKRPPRIPPARNSSLRSSKETLSQRLSLSERQVQRYIAVWEQEDLVRRIERRASNGGKFSNTHDLSGLGVWSRGVMTLS
ncbi:protein of unknown function (plasmid) [Methylocella tundrae]|uniref:Uncharacterized protein n=1 Tax=Methylocella tundrae TaxID=227605 RepID=A0A4U8Z840_METTU|nr:protein of unknown function [Methylocella tundrae]